MWSRPAEDAVSQTGDHGFFLSGALLHHSCNQQAVERLHNDNRQRREAMMPFKAASYEKFLAAKGPSSSCQNADGSTQLFPATVLQQIIGVLRSNVSDSEARLNEQTVEALVPLGSMHEQEGQAAHGPEEETLFLTSVSMALHVAKLQKAAGKVLLAWNNMDLGQIAENEFITALFNREQAKFSACVKDATIYTGAADSVVATLATHLCQRRTNASPI